MVTRTHTIAHTYAYTCRPGPKGDRAADGLRPHADGPHGADADGHAGGPYGAHAHVQPHDNGHDG